MAVEEVRPPAAPPAAPSEGAVDPYTAMTALFGRIARAFATRFFSGFSFEPGDAERLRELERDGAVVYVMRYSSRLDYFLFNWLFLREGVRLSGFANGIRFYYYRPLPEALRLLIRGSVARLRRGFRGMRALAMGRVADTLRSGGSMFLFLRTDKIGSRLRATRRGALASGRSEEDYLQELVQTAFDEPLAVRLVPLALFWRKGPRPRRRFLNLFYGGPERPSDTGKVASFLWNYKNLAVRVGTPIDLRALIDERRPEGPEALVKKVRRSLLIFLRREEKPIAGAALRPVDRTEQLVVSDPDVQAILRETAAESGRSPARLERRARRYLREIAAHPSPTMLAVLDVLVTRLFGRLFERIEVRGLDRIAEAAKQHPLVLVPCHRSHFDYLILSWLFYERHLVPPLVAAGINLSFWPLGPIFRRGGGFFLRRTFEGDRIYATVFRCYVQQLIKDGLTQEFFIEGTRSRTGRTLTPRLGMLNMVLEAYARGVRRDVLLVPIGFTYERLVEEGAMLEERRGAAKARENLAALLAARHVLRRRFGAVSVHFGEPISLAGVLGPSRNLEEARRGAVELLGLEVSQRINRLIAATRTSVVAAVLLASPGSGVRREDLVARARELVAVLELLETPIADVLKEDLGASLESSLALLEESRLISRMRDRRGEIVHFEPGAREVLDYYRGGLTPALALPGALVLGLWRETGESTALASSVLDVLRVDLFPPAAEERERLLGALLEHFRGRGWLGEGPGGAPRVAPEGRPWLELFGAQLLPTARAYAALFEAAAEAEGQGTRGQWLREARDLIRRSLLLGEARFPEAENPTTLENALALLVAEGIAVCDGNARRPESKLAPGPRWQALDELRERLAAALGAR